MDRAHRIGQKKVVNVYRLITRGTLEEKIMRYQMLTSNLLVHVLLSTDTQYHCIVVIFIILCISTS